MEAKPSKIADEIIGMLKCRWWNFGVGDRLIRAYLKKLENENIVVCYSDKLRTRMQNTD